MTWSLLACQDPCLRHLLIRKCYVLSGLKLLSPLLVLPAIKWLPLPPYLLLQGPFSSVVDRHVSDPWLRHMLDLECYVLSGMLAKDTLTAEMVFMFMERSQGKGRIDYPVRKGREGGVRLRGSAAWKCLGLGLGFRVRV